MLSLIDREIVERDPALPGLALLLEKGALAARLGMALEVVYLRYKANVSCTVGLLGPQRTLGSAFAVYAYPEDRYAQVKLREEWHGVATYFDESCIAVLPAGHDRKLRALRRLANPDRRQKFLRHLIGRRRDLTEPEPQVLRYKPGRRLVLQLGDAAGPRAALKTMAHGEFTQSLIGATAAAAFGGAALLAASLDDHTLVSEWIAGTPLCPVLSGRRPANTDLKATGAALARLHSAAFRPPHHVARSHEARELATISGDLAVLAPCLSREMEALTTRIIDALGPAPDPTFIHGDFSADQVVLHGGVPIIIDWDGAATGDPARDVGSFLARLDAQAIDGAIETHDVELAQAGFRDGYGQMRRPLGEAAQHARALVMLAAEGFRSRYCDWPDRTAALLARAEEVLARAQPRSRETRVPDVTAALDITRMHPLLTQALGLSPDKLLLNAPVLLRHKEGSRAIVQYEVEIACGDGTRRCQTLLGKLRVKGPDYRTPRVHADLRAAGLDGRAPRQVGVPAPRGRIDDLHLWLQDKVPGRPAADFLRPEADVAVFARIGAALAALHQTESVTNREWSHDDEFEVLEAALNRSAAHLPTQAHALRAISLGARQRLSALGPGPLCGIHRDFYFDQVLVDYDTVWLVDLDLYARGDPAIDIGNFLAHLDEFGLRRHDDASALEAHGGTFLKGYRSVSSNSPDDRRIALLRAVSLARHVYLSTRFEDRKHTTERLLALSLKKLGATLKNTEK